MGSCATKFCFELLETECLNTTAMSDTEHFHKLRSLSRAWHRGGGQTFWTLCKLPRVVPQRVLARVRAVEEVDSGGDADLTDPSQGPRGRQIAADWAALAAVCARDKGNSTVFLYSTCAILFGKSANVCGRWCPYFGNLAHAMHCV